jgi:hypothetical protein
LAYAWLTNFVLGITRRKPVTHLFRTASEEQRQCTSYEPDAVKGCTLDNYLFIYFFKKPRKKKKHVNTKKKQKEGEEAKKKKKPKSQEKVREEQLGRKGSGASLTTKSRRLLQSVTCMMKSNGTDLSTNTRPHTKKNRGGEKRH